MIKKAGIALCLGLLLVACGSGIDFDEPPEIRYGEDSCERCLMIINEARFAAAYVTAEGAARRFDDIGGMLAFHAEMNEDVAVFWVHDFETEEWLKAEEAAYVHAEGQMTPMGYGIIAFAAREQAESWATGQEAGQEIMVMDFAQLQARGAGEEGEHLQEGDHDG